MVTATGPAPKRQHWAGHDGDAESVATLLAAAASGDRRASRALIDRYAALVWSIAWSFRLNPADAADVTQIVWLRLLENLGRIRDPERLGSWIGSVARHECLRQRRRVEREVASADRFDLDGHGGGPDEGLLEVERVATVRRSFEALPPRWRDLMVALLDAPEASYEEVAAAVGMPVGSIGPTRQRCLDRLRDSPALLALAA
ncbi:MAG: RNA polymerase sigma factor [Acidimicrobiales bacterium]